MRLAINVLLIGCLCLLGFGPAAGLDPTQSLFQYKHTKWTLDNGAPLDRISLAQGRDGYLWIGAREGLYCFDGVSFESILPDRKTGDRTSITALLGARDGSVWAGYGAGGLARYHNGVLRDVGMPHPDANAPDKTVWIVLHDRLVKFAGGKLTSTQLPVVTQGAVRDSAR